jgi:UDP-GlcNAc:undecaprenyl-phosphate GlcNAc-1-phosphate transferase
MGGLIIYTVTITALLVCYKDFNYIKPIVFASLFIFICGVWDDISGLQWKYKFLLQTIAAAILSAFIYPMLGSIEIFGIIIKAPYDLVILTIFIVGVINSINLMDGMDGLVAGFSLQVLWMVLILAAISKNDMLLILTSALIGALFGFLKFNAYPAKIFLGDSGSLTLGLFLVITSLLISLQNSKGKIDLVFSLLLLGVPILDTFKVMFVRIVNRKNPFLPDQNHLHHIIFNGKIRHKTTVFIILSFTSMFAVLAIIYLRYSKIIPMLIFLLLAIILWFMHPILLELSKIKFLIKSRKALIRIADDYSYIFKIIFIPASVPITGLLFLAMLPGSSSLNSNVLIFVISVIVILFFVVYFRRIALGGLNDVFVLINLCIFFICGNHSSPLLLKLNMSQTFINVVQYISLLILFSFMVLFLFQKTKNSARVKIFLTGFDLSLIIFIIFLYILNLFISYNIFYLLGINIIEAFILYIWYKMVLYYDEKFSRFLFYTSFMLPVLSIILIMIYS